MTDTLLTELVEGQDVDEVANTFSKLYPEVYTHNKERLAVAYRSITELADVEECDLLLCVSMEDESSEDWEHVYGLDEKDPSEFDERYALGYMRWSQWLGASVSRETLNDYPPVEIVAHCLYEMTTHGFSEEEIEEIADKRSSKTEEEAFDLFKYFRDEEERSGIEDMRRLLKYEIESSSED